MKKNLVLLMAVVILGLGGLLVYNTVTQSNEGMMTENENMTEEEKMSEDEMMTEAEKIINDGAKATNFELEDLNGNLVTLSQLKGEKVYVKFWASWCSICLAGLEDLDEFSATSRDFKIYTIVSPGYNGEKDLAAFKVWFEKQNIKNLSVLIDQEGEVTRKYGVRGYPTSAFIGSDGVLVHMYPGHLENDVITKEFMKIN